MSGRFTLYRGVVDVAGADTRMSVPRSKTESRGTERLLRDCASVGRMTANDRPHARWRLERELGPRFARQLVAGLVRKTSN